MSVANVNSEILKELCEKIDLLTNLIVNQSTHNYTLKQLCQEVGLTPYSLKQLYMSKRLAIPKPERVNGINPTYTLEDIIYLKKILK